jgi:hypothetical protein
MRKWPPYCTSVSQHSVAKTPLLLFRLFQVPAGCPAGNRQKLSTGEALCLLPAVAIRNSTTPPIEPPTLAGVANGKAIPSMSVSTAARNAAASRLAALVVGEGVLGAHPPTTGEISRYNVFVSLPLMVSLVFFLFLKIHVAFQGEKKKFLPFLNPELNKR